MSETKRYRVETLQLDGGMIGYRCTDIDTRDQVLSGVETSLAAVEALCIEQLGYIREGCGGEWSIDVEVEKP
jgi:hypothetical protein